MYRSEPKLKNPAETIGQLIDKQGVAFISSLDGAGCHVTKAMLPPRRREGIQGFHFTTNTSSRRVAQYRENPKASFYFLDKRFYRGDCSRAGWRSWRAPQAKS